MPSRNTVFTWTRRKTRAHRSDRRFRRLRLIEALEPRYLLSLPAESLVGEGEANAGTAVLTRLFEGLSQLETIGQKIGAAADKAAPKPLIQGQTFVETGLDKLVDLPGEFRKISQQVFDAAKIDFADGKSSVSDPTFDLAVGFTYQITIDDSAPISLRVPTQSYPLGSTLAQRAGQWATALNVSLGSLGARLRWVVTTTVPGETRPALSLQAIQPAPAGEAPIGQLQLMTARVDASTGGVPFGQPNSDLQFEVRNLTLRTLDGSDNAAPETIPPIVLTENFVVSLPRNSAELTANKTNDNTNLQDLADDINAALAKVDVRFPDKFSGANSESSTEPGALPARSNRNLGNYLYAAVTAISGSPRIAIIARDSTVQAFTLQGVGLTPLGFSTPGPLTTNDSTSPVNSKLFIKGQSAQRGISQAVLATATAATNAELKTVVENVVKMVVPATDHARIAVTLDASGKPNQVSFPLKLTNATSTNIAELNLNQSLLVQQVTSGVSSDFGDVQFAGQGFAISTSTLNGELMVGINLIDNDGSPTTDLTETSQLNGGRGLRPAVGIAAARNIPNAVLANSVTLTLSYQSTRDRTEFAEIPVSINRGTTTDNILPQDLIEDINSNLHLNGYDDLIEAKLVDGKLHFRAVDRTIEYLELRADGRANVALGLEATNTSRVFFNSGSRPGDGFAVDSDHVAYPDIIVQLGHPGSVTTYYPNVEWGNLRGVVNDINSQVAAPNFATLESGRIVLNANVPFTVIAATTAGLRSEVGDALGILGRSQTSGAVHRLVGASLDVVDLQDRVFVSAQHSSSPLTVKVDLNIGKESPGLDTGLELGLAVGNTELNAKLPIVGSQPDPLKLSYTLPLKLRDPGIGAANDGRISLTEFLRAEAGDLFQSFAASGVTTSGKLEVLGDVYNIGDVGTGKIATLKFENSSATDLSSLQFKFDAPDAASRNKLQQLKQLRTLSVSDVLSTVQETISKWTAPGSVVSTALHNDLPLVGTSFGEALDFVAEINESLDDVASKILPDILAAQIVALEAALANFPSPTSTTARVRAAIDDLRGELTTLINTVDSSPALATQVSRIIASASSIERELRRLPGMPVTGSGSELDPVRSALLDASKTFSSLVPSVNQVASRLADVLRKALPDLDGVEFKLEPIPDFDNNPANGQQMVLVMGLVLRDGISLDFDPAGASQTALGPVRFSVDGKLNATLGAKVSLGLAVRLSETNPPEVFVLRNPTGGDQRVPTQFTLTGLVEEGSGVVAKVGFGGAALAEGSLSVQLDQPAAPGMPSPNPASLSFGLNGATQLGQLNAIPLNNLGSSTLSVQAAGTLRAAADVSLLGRSVSDAVMLDFNLAALTSSSVPTNWIIKTDELAGLLSDFDFDLNTIIAGVELFLDQLQDVLRNRLKDLPFVGGSLEDLGGYINGLRTVLLPNIRETLAAAGIKTLDELSNTLRTALFSVLDPTVASHQFKLLDGLDSFSAVTSSDIEVTLNRDTFEIKAFVGYNTRITDEFDFDTKLAGLPLSAAGEGGVNLSIDAAAFVGFGIGRSDGFYLLPNPGKSVLVTPVGVAPAFTMTSSQELAVTLRADLAPKAGETATELGLNLFLLAVDATDRGSTLRFDVGADLGGSSKILLPALFSNPLNLQGNGAVNLNLDLRAKVLPGVTQALPQVTAKLLAGWQFTVSPNGLSLGSAGFALNNIELKLGDFLRSTVGEAVKKIKQVLDPVSDIVDLLDTEVPGVSQLSKLAGQGPVTLLDLALAEVPRTVAEETRRFVNFIKALDKVSNRLTANGDVSFGSINFGDRILNADWTERADAVPPRPGFTVALPPALAAVKREMERDPDEESPAGAAGTGPGDGLGLSFPIIDQPENFIKMLLGQTVYIVTWDIPKLAVNFPWSQSFPILPFPPISVEVGLEVGFSIDLGVGFDSRGLQTGNLLDGFYFDDLSGGQDIDELQFSLNVSAAALLDAGIASAGIRGVVTGLAKANLRDPDANGKFYVDEIAAILKNDGAECLFDLSAELRAKLQLVWEVLFLDGKVNIVDLELFKVDNTNSCPTQVAAHVSDGSIDGISDGDRKFSNQLPTHIAQFMGASTPGELAPAGTLIIHSGAFAHQRVMGKSSDTAESFKLTKLAPGVVRVEGMGIDQRFGGVERIVFDGGAGNDQLLLQNGLAGDANSYRQFNIPIIAFGGVGADVLYGGALIDSLFGEAGDDRIYSGPGADLLDGGDGADHLYGDDGDDTFRGGKGDDTVFGEGGGDILEGQEGNDTIWGGYLNNVATPAGRTGDANDTIRGGRGCDEAHGGPGNDAIWGDAGDDLLFGDNGSDRIDGGDGHDFIDGGADADGWLHGGLGNDYVVGGTGTDSVLGGWGNDVLIGDILQVDTVGGTDSDLLEGGPDNDFICGTGGADTIHGGTTARGYTGQLPLFAAVPFDDKYEVLPGGYSLNSCTTTTPPLLPAPQPGSALFRVFRDANNDRLKGSGESFDNGWVVRLETAAGELIGELPTADIDLNDDGVFDAATEHGVIRFDDLDPGTYRARIIIPAIENGIEKPYTLTNPDLGFHLVTIGSGQTRDGGEFGVYQKPVLRGFVFNDLNNNGSFDNEPGMAGVRVYLDQVPIGGNGNLDLDSDLTFDTYTLTAADGTYAFAVEGDPSDYYVRQAINTNQTFPGPLTGYGTATFTSSIGSEWIPARRAVSPNGTAFAGQFGEESVRLVLDDLPDHEEIEISFDLYIIGAWIGGNSSTSDIDRLVVDIVNPSGTTNKLIDATFSNGGEFAFDQSFRDSQPVGAATLVAPRTDNDGLNLLSYQFTQDSRYRFSGNTAFTRTHFGNNLELRFTGVSLESGKTFGIDNVRIVTRKGGQPVSLPVVGDVTVGPFGNHSPAAAGSLVHAATFASSDSNASSENSSLGTQAALPVSTDGTSITDLVANATTGIVSGRRFNDFDLDGVFDATEKGITNQRLYVDLNGNGQLDSDEPQTLTNGRGEYHFHLQPGTYTIREVLPEGWEETAPLGRPFAISTTGKLTEVDAGSGAIVHTRTIQTPITISQWIGLAYDSQDQVLLAVGNPSSGNSYLFELDPLTAQASVRTQLRERLTEGDIVIQPETGRLLAVTNRGNDISFLVEIDKQSGSIRTLSSFGGGEFGIAPGDPSAMAFSATGSNLYILDRNYGSLYRLDPSSGATLSPLRALEFSNVGRVAGMVWEPTLNSYVLVAGSPNSSFGPPDFVSSIYTFSLASPISLHRKPISDLGLSLSGMTLVPHQGHIVTIAPNEFGKILSLSDRDFGNVPARYIWDGKDHIEGHSGNDMIWGDNVLDVGSSLPRVVLIGDDDVLAGGSGNDSLFGQQKEDTLWGGSNLNAGASLTTGNQDILDGGAGKNLVVQWVNKNQSLLDYAATTALTNDARLQGEGAETSLINIYRARLVAGDAAGFTIDASAFTLGPVELIGGAGGDTLIGSPQNDRFEGRGGDDFLHGNAGDDVFLFDVDDALGKDTFPSGTFTGNDTLDFSATTGLGITVDLSNTGEQLVHSGGNLRLILGAVGSDSAAENIIGGALADTLSGNNLSNRMAGGPGGDTMRGHGGNDTFIFEDALTSEIEQVAGDAGTDTLDFSRLSSDQHLKVNFGGTGTVLAPWATMTNRSVVVMPSTGGLTLEQVIGTAGDDEFRDGAGIQSYFGGKGDDVYFLSNTTNVDTIVENVNEGKDRLNFSAITIPLRIDLATAPAFFAMFNYSAGPDFTLVPGASSFLVTRVQGAGQFEEVIGGSGRDDIYGTNGDDYIDGWLGADRLTGRSGDDTYAYSQFTTTGATQSGDSIVEASNDGSDTLSFGENSDPVASTRNISVHLGTGTAAIGPFSITFTGNRIENVLGGNGNDTLTGSNSSNFLFGGSGNDTLDGFGGSDALSGGQGNDVYRFSALNAVFQGTSGWLIPPEFGSLYDPDLLLDSRGLPLLDPSGRGQVVDGGIDRLDFSSTPFLASLSVNLAPAGIAVFQVDNRNPLAVGSIPVRQLTSSSLTIQGASFPSWIESVTGSAIGDTIVGNERNNVLSGLGGNDAIQGLDGNDVILGGAGSNTLLGGRGDDRYQFDWANDSQDILVEDTGSAAAGLVSSGGADTLDFSGVSGALTFSLATFDSGSSTPPAFSPGVRSNTRILLKNSSQSLSNNSQFDGNGFENLLGASSVANNLTGNSQANIVIGGGLADTLNGGTGRDFVIGGAGLDNLNGGNDSTSGSAGEDIVIGGNVNFGTSGIDAMLASLNAIRRAWIDSGSFAVRQAAIVSGVGAPNLNAKLVSSGAGATVQDDGSADSISNATGDWIIEPGFPAAVPASPIPTPFFAPSTKTIASPELLQTASVIRNSSSAYPPIGGYSEHMQRDWLSNGDAAAAFLNVFVLEESLLEMLAFDTAIMRKRNTRLPR